jgi:predicted TIM-barrel fold metal-dependent hydrolase
MLFVYILAASYAVVLAFPSKYTTRGGSCDETDSRTPESSWDSHLHVLNPIDYPIEEGSEYTPGVYTVWDNAIFENRLGPEHVVLIQPSIYGTNNTLLLKSLRAYGTDRARGVVVFNIEETTMAELNQWHVWGVRGVRINFLSTGETPPADELKKSLSEYSNMVKSLGWVVQLYIAMDIVQSIEDFLPSLGMQIVFDHIGVPDIPEQNSTKSYNPSDIAGFDSMVRLLQQNVAWVKISGPYRVSNVQGPIYYELDPLILELFRVAPSRLVYASDWPHTRFEGLDIKPWTSHLLDLTEGQEKVREGLFRDNAMVLWQAEDNHF